MEAKRGRNIHFGVGVVGLMEPPEQEGHVQQQPDEYGVNDRDAGMKGEPATAAPCLCPRRENAFEQEEKQYTPDKNRESYSVEIQLQNSLQSRPSPAIVTPMHSTDFLAGNKHVAEGWMRAARLKSDSESETGQAATPDAVQSMPSVPLNQPVIYVAGIANTVSARRLRATGTQ